MVQTANNEQLLKLLFDMKQEMSSYKKETNTKIANLENTRSVRKLKISSFKIINTTN